nr:MAG TPA: hypothetical protein [Caudoviricetes sp.]
MYDDRSGIVRPFPEPIALNVVTVLISFHSFGKLPFSVVDQMAGAATRAPERSPHGLHKI